MTINSVFARPCKFFTLIQIFVASVAFSATYYVSPSGSDANNGSTSSPFKTVQHAADIVQPGDKVTVRAGVYYERIVMKTSGTATAPIVFEGEMGGTNEWKTVINGSDPVTGWVQAPEKGTGAWKKTNLPYELGFLMEGEKYIQLLKPNYMYRLGTSANEGAETNGYYSGVTVNYWDGVEAVCGAESTTIYVRYRNGDDPNQKDMRVGPMGVGILVFDKNFVTIRNFKILGSRFIIGLFGKSSYNIIEGNWLLTGRNRVLIQGTPSDNVIRNNRMQMNAIGFGKFYPGASSFTRMQGAVSFHIYMQNKYDIGGTMEDDSNIEINVGPPGRNRVIGNLMEMGCQGMRIERECSTMVAENIIRNQASQGIYNTAYLLCGNLIYDAQHLIRVNNGNIRQTFHIVGNRFWEPYPNEQAGKHVALYVDGINPWPVWIYHNSFAGGGKSVEINGAKDRTEKIHMVNNIFSSYWISSGGFGPTPGAIFAYNWVNSSQGAPPFAEGNIKTGTRMWPDDSLPSSWAPSGAAVGSGIDLSKPFTVGGKSFRALPGLAPGYFSGSRPDMGASIKITLPSLPQPSIREIPVQPVFSVIGNSNHIQKKIYRQFAWGQFGNAKLFDIHGRRINITAISKQNTGVAGSIYFTELNTSCTSLPRYGEAASK